MKKDTDALMHEIRYSNDVKNFIISNQKELTSYSLSEYLDKLLTEKKLSKANVINASGLNQVYAYHIFSGMKNPSRDKVLALALALKLTPKEAQYLLKYAKAKELYVRNKRDSILIFALNQRLNAIDTNQLLAELSEPILE